MKATKLIKNGTNQNEIRRIFRVGKDQAVNHTRSKYDSVWFPYWKILSFITVHF